MDTTKTREFVARIADASRSELTVIIYDVILEDINEAQKLAGADKAENRKLLLHANRFVNELMRTLDFKYELAADLWKLYEYVGEQLTAAAFSADLNRLEAAKEVVEKLRSAFLEVAKQDNSGPLMTNAQQITAGLTYGKGSLNEMTIDSGNRGFLA